MNTVPYLPSLTPLRGLAALLIVLHHLTAFFLPDIGELVARHSGLLKNGFLCVDFFFILSGFTLAYLYSDKLCGSDIRQQHLTFIVRRFARIYPLHLVTIFAMLLLAFGQLAAQIHNQGLESYLSGSWWKIGHGHFGDLILNLLMLQAIPAYTSWNGPAWSISAEWFVYLLFPLLLAPTRLLPRFNNWACLPLVLLGLSLIEWGYGTLDVAGPASIARCFLEAWLGITFHAYFAKTKNHQFWRDNTVMLSAMLFVLFAMHYRWFQTLVIVPMAVIIVCAIVNQNWLTQALNRREGIFIGELSFSIYMTHWVLMSWATWLWRGFARRDIQDSYGVDTSILVLVIGIALILVVSYFCHRYIELPCRTWIRKQLRSNFPPEMSSV